MHVVSRSYLETQPEVLWPHAFEAKELSFSLCTNRPYAWLSEHNTKRIVQQILSSCTTLFESLPQITNSCPSPERQTPKKKVKATLRSKFASEFMKIYDSGHLPLKTEQYGTGLRIRWTADFKDLDYLNLVPLLLKGMFLLSFDLQNIVITL